MPVATALAIFFLIWWVVLFAVLPWGIRSQHESEDEDMVAGTDPGAPVSVQIGRKLLWTTLVAIAIYAVCFFVYSKHWITIDSLLAISKKQ
jgi:predicted secreted protein